MREASAVRVQSRNLSEWQALHLGAILDNMNKIPVHAILAQHKPILVERFGVKRIALFGSYAKGQATENSDIDLLVEFSGAATASGFFGLQFYLEDLFGKPIDLVTENALRPEFRPYVERGLLTI